MTSTIKIKNIYYMLTYAFQNLNEQGLKSVEAEDFENIHDLFASIIVKGVTIQIKRGLQRDYVVHSGALSSLRGKIDVSQSIKELTIMKHRMICHYDEFSEDEQLNQILKTTMSLLHRYGQIKTQNRMELRRLLLYFGDVTDVDPMMINWRAVKYHRNNVAYKALINLCWLAIKGLLQTESDGTYKLARYLDDQKMYQLYERFVLNYYRKEHPHLSACASFIDWDTDADGDNTFLPVMKSDITLARGSRKLIIDTKCYSHTMQTNSLYQSISIISANLYQIYAYVKNTDVTRSGNISGVLLYAKTDEDITPDNDYLIGGNRIGVKTLDLNDNFQMIRKQLDELCEIYLT